MESVIRDLKKRRDYLIAEIADKGETTEYYTKRLADAQQSRHEASVLLNEIESAIAVLKGATES